MNAHSLHRLVALVALSFVATPPAAAQYAAMGTVASAQPHGFVVERPGANAVSPRNGLQLQVDSRWLNNYGYRPLRLRVWTPKPATRDHIVTVRMYVAPWEWQSASVVAVEQRLELPLGSTLAEATISCPQFQTGQRYWWDVWVNGVKDETLSVDLGRGWQLTAASATPPGEATLKFMLLAPASQTEATLIPAADVFEAVAVPMEELPTRWIDYTAVDVMALSPGQLARIESQRPEALAAIRRWVRAGGQLWVSPVGGYWDELARVERLLQLEPPSDASGPVKERRETDDEIAARGWKPIDIVTNVDPTSMATFLHLPTGRTRVVRDPTMIERLKSDSDWIITDERTNMSAEDLAAIQSQQSEDASDEQAGDADVEEETDELPPNSVEWYVERPVGLGRVRVFRHSWDAVGFGISWRMLFGFGRPDPEASRTPLAAAVQSTRGWESRHGMTPDTANADFANLLVPGVGLAPVTEFRVLITLFVLGIGPLNYWLLHRSGRLYLLVLTVPAVALLLTGALFGYALLSDGFGTTVRVRSFTALDQRTGEAACWSRLSYYAGLAPSRGLTLPDDVALYPIRPGWVEAGTGASLRASRKLEWADGEQRFAEGWLRSRTPTQYLTVRARKSPHRLVLKSADDNMTVANELGAAVEYLVVADEDGRLFAGEAIAKGATTKLPPTTDVTVVRQLRQLIAANEPEAPAALADGGEFLMSSRRRYRRRFELEYGLERLDTNLQNHAIDALLGGSDESPLGLPPRSYVAITDTGPEVEIGLQRAREEASFHVVVGSW